MIITLVYPRFQTRNAGGLEEPLGLLYLAAQLQAHGHTARFVDLTFSESLSDLNELIHGADWVGISSTSPLFGRAIEVGKYIKSQEPDIPLVCGGPHATTQADDVLAKGFDYAVIGEAEDSVLEFTRLLAEGRPHEARGIAYKDEDGTVVHTPRFPLETDLDRFPYPVRDAVHYEGYGTFGSIVTRGCPFECTYCKPMQDHLFGSKIRRRTAENVVNEIEQLFEIDPKKVIYFKDDILTILNVKWFEQFAEQLDRRGLKPRWQGNSRVDTVNYRKLELMKSAGCVQIAFGVESGSQRILDFYKKGTTVEQAEDAFAHCHALGILPHAFVMLGAPIEKREDMEQTYQHMKTIRPKSWLVSTVTPFPGNGMYSDMIDQGHFVPPDDYELYDNAQNSVEGRLPMQCEFITVKDVNEYRNKINRYLLRANMFDPMVWRKSLGRPGDTIRRVYDIFVH